MKIHLMKTNLTLFLLAFFLFQNGIAQIETCGTDSNNSINYELLLGNQRARSSQISICVDVQFYILKNNGGNVIPIPEVYNIFSTLKNAFDQHSIFLNRLPLNYIQDSNFLNIDQEDFENMAQLYQNPNAINIYIVNYMSGAKGATIEVPSIFMALNSQNDLSSSTVVHEMGHAFGLYHTHETDFGVENIVRSPHPNANCEQAGDKLCSTPADTNLLNLNIDPPEYKVNQNCVYTAGETRNGLPYNPDTHNYMSYSREDCRDSFTQEQVAVMRAMLQSSPVLQPVLSDLCRITGPPLICNTETYTVGNSNNLPVTWSVPQNLLHKVSWTNTSITVEPVDPYASGQGHIEAHTASQTVHKDVWVGPPGGNYQLNGPSVSTVYADSFSNFSVSPSPSGVSYYWFINTSSSNCPPLPNTSTPTFYASGTSSLTTSQHNVIVLWGNCPGWYSVNCLVQNACGSSGVGHQVMEVADVGVIPCEGQANIYPNPVDSGDITVNIVDNPCDDIPQPPNPPAPLTHNDAPAGNLVKIYDLYGAERFSNSYPSDNFTITGLNLETGSYILNILTGEGDIVQEIFVVE